MAKITFTPQQKAQAMKLINERWTAAEVCEEIGCSMASLQNWKKDFKEGKISLSDLPLDGDEDEEEEEETAPSKGAHKSTPMASYSPPKCIISREDFIKDYWKSQSVGDVMKMPESIDEVVKLVNHALKFAYDHLKD